MSTETPFEKSYHIALYQDLDYPRQSPHVSTYFGTDDNKYHGGDVRISEPLSICFVALSTDEAIQTAVATLDAAEKKAFAECNAKVAEIRAQKANLLALTHHVESV